MTTEDLLAAIKGGVDTANDTGGPPPIENDDGGSDENGNDSVSELSANAGNADGETGLGDGQEQNGDGQAAGKDGTDPNDGDESADGDKEKAGGKPAAGKDKTKEGDDADPKGGKPNGEPKELTPEQLLDAPVDKRLRQETQERIRGLVQFGKTAVAERDQAVRNADELIGVITQSGASPEQYGQALDYIKAVNSNDPVQMKQALVFMQNEVKALATMLGMPVPGVDFLADHEDLREAVVNGTMSEQHAIELAAARSSQQVNTQRSHAASQRQQQEERQNTAIAAGKAALNVLEARLKKSDPQYDAKRAILIEAMRPAISSMSPDKWAVAWENAYKKLNLPAPRTNANGRTGVPQNQPLRAKNPAGGEQRAAGSLSDAIRLGVKQASGG